MSDIVIHDNHCALILNKEEATLIASLVGSLTSNSVDGSANIYYTIIDSGFISADENNKWWENHELMAKTNCKIGASLPASAMIIMKKGTAK